MKELQIPGIVVWIMTACLCIVEAQNEVDGNGNQQHDGEDSRAKSVIVWTGASVADGACSPVVGNQSIDHDRHC